MSIQVLCCVETNAQANTDYQYIKETIRRFYIDDKKKIVRAIYLDSKTRYKDKSVLDQIESRSKRFAGKTVVIYFVDFDDCDTNAETAKLYAEIERYCKNNVFEFVYFSRDIEDVYLGKQIHSTEKVAAVERFKRLGLITEVKESNLRIEDCKRHHSNILMVLDKIWTRK